MHHVADDAYAFAIERRKFFTRLQTAVADRQLEQFLELEFDYTGGASGRSSETPSRAGRCRASRTTAGTGTHYVLTGTGNCSYRTPPADGLFVALSPAEYHGAAACGGYVEVSGPQGSVRAEVIDQCPPCAAGHIDLSEAAFARIAPLSAGLVSVTYRAVADPALPAPVALRVKEGSSRYWLALLAMNTGNPLASVQVESAAGGWRDLVRADYNYWIASSGGGGRPVHRAADRHGRPPGHGARRHARAWRCPANGNPAVWRR